MVLSETRGVLAVLSDCLTRKEHVSKVLHDAKLDRDFFDPKNPEHIRAYAIFRNEGRWIMKFHAEGQYATIPGTIEKKIIDMVLAENQCSQETQPTSESNTNETDVKSI